jgi:hypothetical protein
MRHTIVAAFMSMTLILWKAPYFDDPDEAKVLFDPWYETGDESAFEPSEDIARVAEALRSRWPDAYEGQPPEDCPWADMPFEQSDRLLAIHIRWGADDRAVAAIYVLAKKFGLLLYDPQGPDIFLPTDPVDPGPVPLPTAWEWFKGFAIAAFLCGVTYAAWLIPIGWVRWPAVIVAGFFAAAGLFVVGAMIAGILGLIDVDDGARPCHEDEPPL